MFDAVKKLLSRNYGVDPEKITLDTHLCNELGLSGESMDDLSKLETISDLIDYLEEY